MAELARHAVRFFFFFNDTATTEIYTLSLHDALPISSGSSRADRPLRDRVRPARSGPGDRPAHQVERRRSEEHTSELQSLAYLVCRLLLEKKKNTPPHPTGGVPQDKPPTMTDRGAHAA